MVCVECSSAVDEGHPISGRIGCQSFEDMYPCTNPDCGRLHWASGKGVLNQSGQRSFVDADGRQFLKHQTKDEIVSRQ